MTGTPVSEDFEGLFYQIMTVDAGTRFGKNKQKFLEEYFFQADWQGYDYQLRPDGAERIVKAINDLVYTLPDYRHQLPELIQETIEVELPQEARGLYKDLVKNGEIETSAGLQSCDNAAVLSGKLEQLASGALYNVGEWGERISVERVHDAKMIALENLLDQLYEPVVICYWYQHELDRLREAYPFAVNLGDDGAIDRWNSGEIDILLMQPMSASHGIELQYGGAVMIWFKPVWSNDIKSQADARLWRRGQTKPVRVIEIVSKDTVDEMITDRVHGKRHFNTLFKSLTDRLSQHPRSG